MDNETVKVIENEDGYEIVVQHNKTSSYGMKLPKNVYEQLRSHFNDKHFICDNCGISEAMYATNVGKYCMACKPF